MLDGEVVSNPSDDEDEAPRLRHGTLTSDQLNKRIEQLKEAEAREAAEPQAEECTGKGEECTCAWAHVGVHNSMCEAEVEGRGKGKRKRPEPPWAKVRNISDMLVESIENINRSRMQKLEKHKNQTERVAEEGAKPAEDKVINEEMPDSKVIDEEMRQSRKLAEDKIIDEEMPDNKVIKRGCVLCWPDKASCSSEICRARTRARLARSP